jgi:hypothetical protein
MSADVDQAEHDSRLRFPIPTPPETRERLGLVQSFETLQADGMQAIHVCGWGWAAVFPAGLYPPCGCRKPHPAWSSGLSVLLDETVTTGCDGDWRALPERQNGRRDGRLLPEGAVGAVLVVVGDVLVNESS